MSGDARQKGEFLEAIYEKTRAPGAWKGAGKDTVETVFDDLRINIDRVETAEFTSYSLWIHGPDSYIEEICDLDLTNLRPASGLFSTYGELLQEMYWSASDVTPAVDPLADALSKIRGADGPSE